MAGKEFQVNGKTYTSLQLLGIGCTGKVYACLDQDNAIVAIKDVDLEGKGPTFRQSILSELQILKKLQQTGKVIKYIDSEEKGDHLYIVMEKGDTDLQKYFEKGKIDRVKRQFYWQEMLAAVKTLHDNKIIHKDLKPQNFVLVQGSLKLIDFGLAKMISTDQSGTFLSQGGAGTMDYISPEVLSGDPSTKVSTRCDVWSLGCMLYYMAYGRTPFGHIPPYQRVTAIIDPKVSIKVPKEDEMDILMYDVLRKCLQRDPKERATVEELLEHPFLKPNAPMTNLKYALKAMTTTDSDDDARSHGKIGILERKTSGPRRKVGHPMILDIDRSKGGSGAMGVSCYSPSNIDPETFMEMEKIGDGSKVVLTITPKEPGVHILKIKLNGKEVQGSPWKFQIDQPEPDNKIPVPKKN